MAWAGTSSTTTALAPMFAPCPMCTGPDHLGARTDERTGADGGSEDVAVDQAEGDERAQRDPRLDEGEPVDDDLAMGDVDARPIGIVADAELSADDRDPVEQPGQQGDPDSSAADPGPIRDLGEEGVGDDAQAHDLDRGVEPVAKPVVLAVETGRGHGVGLHGSPEPGLLQAQDLADP